MAALATMTVRGSTLASGKVFVPSQYALDASEMEKYAHVCVFGSFAAEAATGGSLPVVGPVPTHCASTIDQRGARLSIGAKHMAPLPVPRVVVHSTTTAKQVGSIGQGIVNRNQQTVRNAFAALEDKCVERLARMGPQTVIKKRGVFTTRSMTASEVQRAKDREYWLANRKHDMTIQPTVITSITLPEEQEMDIVVKGPSKVRGLDKKKRHARPKQFSVRSYPVEVLLHSLLKITASNKIPIYIMEKKRANKVTHNRRGGSYHLRCSLPHMEGERKLCEVTQATNLMHLARKYNDRFNADSALTAQRTEPGDSGLIVRSRLSMSSGEAEELVIVRGQIDGHIVDARSQLSVEQLLRIREFSKDVAHQFWEGLDKKFLQNKPFDLDHICESNFKVTKCGELAGILTQVIYPCGRITCAKCVSNFSHLTRLEYGSLIQPRVDRALHEAAQYYKEFSQVPIILEHLTRALNLTNNNTEAFGSTNAIVFDRKEAPFSHIREINDILIKCGDANTHDFERASAHLLEIARYLKNRTDVITESRTARFRNKASAKSHFNADLLCDNQLDRNGNFIWGQRGYHAKRFLSNYFTKIEPTRGYREFTSRKNPNGARTLAIDRLIVSTNLDTFRQQMMGTCVHKVGITDECTSKRNGAYVYQCCCVTDEDGQPIESPFLAPTKHHLVLGNTGEAKYVDLPQDTDQQMYIAKDGYCYINIFFAMLINVREDQAKAFTKMVRDMLIPKLGEWPTMMDVATACRLLTVFFPDTTNAELPRIFVDHTAKIMHVIDSYGSADTGYHVFKAGTISQLMLMSSNDVDSEMKYYRVGGKFVASDSVHTNFTTLIKSIYREGLMREILSSEPYLVLLAVTSPGVLLALFNSGSLEIATKMWIRRDQGVAQIMTMLSILAAKISVSRLLLEQKRILDENAGFLLKAMEYPYFSCRSADSAVAALMVMDEEFKADQTMRDNGFYAHKINSYEIIEKSYMDDLEESWRELRWWEKLSLIIHSRRLRQRYIGFVELENKNGIIGRYSTSLTALCGLMKHKCYNKICKLKNSAKSKMYNTVGKVTCVLVGQCKYLFPDLMHFVNMLTVFGLLLAIYRNVFLHISEYKSLKSRQQTEQDERNARLAGAIYKELGMETKVLPTVEEFRTRLGSISPELLTWFDGDYNLGEYIFQAKTNGERNLERVVAISTLLLMIFDAERSDAVYKVLNKLKTLIGVVEAEPMRFQSLDDVRDTLEEKNMTIDFEIQSNDICSSSMGGITFSQWWDNQLLRNNIIPHYRTEGHFIEFTRENAASVANEISHSVRADYLVRGAVGSGKSTGLPFHLCGKGCVLLIEPTRPLAENVYKQLKQDPFFVHPTLRMRGVTHIGSSPITIMTSGFALHYYAHNIDRLKEVQFVIFDECHVHDASAMAFRCLLSEYAFGGKILKVSATPPGREVEFKTQKPVQLLIEESLTMQQFVANLGTKANSDVTATCNNILVYVASYNEVDMLSKLLIEKKYKVTKVDGRTMKAGHTEIETSGTTEKKHFIVATNIIENGVTLDIDAVVDFGTKVVPELDADSRLVRYRKVNVSYGERIQRLGRVGRFKAGVALRIGSTEKGLQAVPSMVATEAAFYSFTYGLPVMTEGVSTSLLGECTVLQARTMQHFELPIFFTAPLVRFDGTMHALVHRLLVPFKLRDSDITLNKLAIPTISYTTWKTAKEYAMNGCKLNLDDTIRIPFYARDVPEKLMQDLDEVIKANQRDGIFGRVSSASAARIAYTLQTDPCSIQRTIAIIDKLIESEQMKKAHFDSVTSRSVSSSSFSLASIINAIKARHMTDHTAENIGVLQAARGQLLEFKNITLDWNNVSTLRESGALECVRFQSAVDISKHLQLKGHWNKSIITTDAIIVGTVLAGGLWMLCTQAQDMLSGSFSFEAKNKRQRQKLRFREARDNKMAREVYGDDGTLAEYFGTKYTSKGKTKGTTHGMGQKTRRFYNMYGFDPTEYSFARYVDPLTGVTIDESPLTDLTLVQDHFGKVRHQYVLNDELDRNQVRLSPPIEAYFVKDAAKEVLRVDLTPHNPLRLCDRVANVAGYPEREFELRQSGQPVMVPASMLPERKEYNESMEFESASTFHGLRDYNPIATTICNLQNSSDGVVTTLFGVGYGSVIIANQHLFRNNNGSLLIRSHHGEFRVPNTTQLSLYPIDGRDILLIRLPKDFPPFPRKLKFRCVNKGEKVCLVGSNFQTKSISSTVSETSVTAASPSDAFTKHWITTKDGQCGLPIVSVKDGMILGIHSLTCTVNTTNMFANIPEQFEENVLSKVDTLEWTKKWRLNVDKANWGAVNIKEDQPTSLFKLSKEITDIDSTEWNFQAGFKRRWLFEQLEGNLKAVGAIPNALVTKHVVRGKCSMFATYLDHHDSAKSYFQPLMGEYQKSRLNREAYVKDLKKYSSEIIIGEVHSDAFETAFQDVVQIFTKAGFKTCAYITDPGEIFGALNKKAATGALYSGKKGDYLAGYTANELEQMLQASCERLFLGKMGVWNGSLKAELRSKEKCIANKTRSFTAAPIDTLLGGKTCVDDFNNQFYALHFQLPSSVGMTKFYRGWDTLLRKLPDGWVYCDADGSQFDSSLSPYLINAVLDLRLHFMEDWDIGQEMLQNLYTEIVYTPIATPDGTIVKKFKGNNSGQPSTVVDNTIMVMLAMCYSIRVSGVNLESDDFIKYFINGDDLLIAIRPDMAHMLDNFSDTFLQLGLKYTFDNRTTQKSDLWFMSHQGILRDGILIPKLERERIVSILEWDRADQPEHRLEAICAAMIEAWGYDDLIQEIRKFYYWLLHQEPYNELSAQGKAPYISEVALKALYTGVDATEEELSVYTSTMHMRDTECECVYTFQADEEAEIDAGRNQAQRGQLTPATTSSAPPSVQQTKEPDVNVGSSGSLSVPRLKNLASRMSLPMVRGKSVVNLDHLLIYNPEQTDLYNTRATQAQFDSWYDNVMREYELDDAQMKIVMNGLMVWCIENGTSPNLHGTWVMMDGAQQVEFPIKPLLDHAQPTFRQIMAHFSALAEAYIIKRNAERPYMPRYALKRNLVDMSLAQYAFDFLEITSRTPARAREAQAQMKAAALKNARSRMFGLDGSVNTVEEDTERHTTTDVNRSMHSMLGVRM